MTSTEQEQATKDAVTRFMECLSIGDIPGTLDALTEDATWWVGGNLEGFSGTKTKEEFSSLLITMLQYSKNKGISLKPLSWIVEGNRAAVEAESYAELVNGRVYNNMYHFMFEVKDGKIYRGKEFFDTEHTRAVWMGL